MAARQPRATIDLAYAAGLIDGEGHITILTRGKNPWRKPFLCVANTEKELVRFLQQRFGGGIYIQRRPNKKEVHVWRLLGNPCLALLPKLIPFMRDKKKLARARMLVKEYPKYSNPRGVSYTARRRLAKHRFEERFLGLPTQNS